MSNPEFQNGPAHLSALSEHFTEECREGNTEEVLRSLSELLGRNVHAEELERYPDKSDNFQPDPEKIANLLESAIGATKYSAESFFLVGGACGLVSLEDPAQAVRIAGEAEDFNMHHGEDQSPELSMWFQRNQPLLTTMVARGLKRLQQELPADACHVLIVVAVKTDGKIALQYTTKGDVETWPEVDIGEMYGENGLSDEAAQAVRGVLKN